MDFGYEIQFWGEGTSHVDSILVVRYDTGSRSILSINTDGTCLKIGNSYNDAGGDSCYQKEVSSNKEKE